MYTMTQKDGVNEAPSMQERPGAPHPCASEADVATDTPKQTAQNGPMNFGVPLRLKPGLFNAWETNTTPFAAVS